MSDQPKTIPFPVTPELELDDLSSIPAPVDGDVLTIARSPVFQAQALINGQWVDVEDVRFRLQDDSGD